MDVVIANIQDELQDALEILVVDRRKLQADQQPTLNVNRVNGAKTKAAKAPKGGGTTDEIPGADESESYRVHKFMPLPLLASAFSFLQNSYTMNASTSNSNQRFACTVAMGILDSATAAEGTKIVIGLLNQIFASDSYTTVLSGGDRAVFQGNISGKALC